MRLISGIELQQLITETLSRWPNAQLGTNAVGNLVAIVDGEWVAYLDFVDVEVHTFN
ncbi:TPA_asm: hypothetical protein PROPHIFSQJ01-1_86 [Mycobacterium phage prophiFSQJ01-1]|nr:Uncharacterised protein [Mycobacteroides abscessus subsp. abscessus]SIK13221.1 Uncharacterised protein [Mycobacteroides abscessus subsp. abscessus]SIN25920.1 Uncharacterised protein [Mycobacteroides abscessus subsp. abscessus]SLI51028.1 Uncharacterised protein [Mycobacteroides abscessus subsp. abscessus]DAZ90372.1 TPA_asm: hypothetical protein PROPHIFSQJ01-1_86 [Mycobacterium phage prophiFSQJ01-1]